MKTFTQRVELRVNSVLVALDRLGRISNAENVVTAAQRAKIAAVVDPALKECYANMTTKDRQASGFKF